MWNPFKRKNIKRPQIEQGALEKVITENGCFAVLYYVGDKLNFDFQFNGTDVNKFVELISAMSTGHLYANMITSIISVMENSGATKKQIQLVITMIEERIAEILELEEDDEYEEPVIKPLNVFMPPQGNEEEEDE